MTPTPIADDLRAHDPRAAATLDAWRSPERRHAPTHGHGLSDHLPMLLQALHALGAPAERLDEAATDYARRLTPRPGPAQADAPADWTALLGRRDAFEPLLAHFEAALQRDGLAATLRAALPRLMPGVGADAFHGLIRTGHAVDTGHLGEAAMGLAYWASAWLPLAAAPLPVRGELGLADWCAAVQALRPAQASQAPLIALRMAEAARDAGFVAVAGALRIDDPAATLNALARAAAALYAASGNFTVLHAVTASRAMRLLAPWQADPTAALRDFTLAVAAGLLASRLERFDLAPDTTAAAPGWPALQAAALAARDDHTAKLVQACRDWDRWTPDPLWRQAAQRATGVVAPSASPAPPSAGFDHVHLDVADRPAAAAWYARTLGLEPVAALAHWARDGGPLVLADAAAGVHVALFERRSAAARPTMALRVAAAHWPAWRDHLARAGVATNGADHGQAQSIYFADPDGNGWELTCYEVDALRALNASAAATTRSATAPPSTRAASTARDMAAGP